MGRDEALMRLDGIAALLCRAYADLGVLCCIVRSIDDGGCRIITQAVPAAALVPMLQAAADDFEKSSDTESNRVN